MPIPYSQILGALRVGSVADLLRGFHSLSLAEKVELGTFIGPRRLAAVIELARRNRDEQAVVLAESNRQGFGQGGAPPATENQSMSKAVSLALTDVANRRRISPLLTMPTDVTGTLGTPRSLPPALNDADYQAAADRLQMEAAAIKAVATVESGGRSGFDDRGRPKILFEAHHFGPLTSNRFNKTHPHLAVGQREARKARAFYHWDQYERLYEAMLLDVDAALKAASWASFRCSERTTTGGLMSAALWWQCTDPKPII